MSKVLVIAPPPTPNGDLHVGHLSGPYLRADVYTRYLKLRGVEAYLLTGVDEHQSYVAAKGEQLGLGAAETADRFGDEMLKTLQAARIEAQTYARPRRSRYHSALVKETFEKLYREGMIVARESDCLYCEICGRYLFEAYVAGKCPHCRSGSGGNACEDCGRPNDCIDLEEAACARCGNRPAVRSFTRLYFLLSRCETRLRAYHGSTVMSSRMRALCEGMLEDGLPDIAISHFSDWGLPIPLAGFDDQRFYAWFEMAAGELAATSELADEAGLDGGWKCFLKSKGAEVVKFCGFDNSYFYSVFFPAILTSFDPAIKLPEVFITNEFYRLDGSKFSTSRDHVIWGRDILAKTPVDCLRFYLAYSGPETEGTNFTIAEYQTAVDRDLISGVERWLRRLGEVIDADFDGYAPGADGWTADQHRFYGDLELYRERASEAYEARTFSTRLAARVIIDLARAAAEFQTRESNQAFSKHNSRCKASVALQLAAAKTLAVVSAPIMPDFGARLWESLGCEGPIFSGCWNDLPSLVPAGTRVRDLNRSYFSS